MTNLPTTDKPATAVSNVVQSVVSDLETATDTAIIASVPWMGTVVLKQAWEAVVHLLFGKLGNALGRMAGYVVIDVQEYLALRSASKALADLRAANAKGNANEISNANAAADAAASGMLHFVGSIKS